MPTKKTSSSSKTNTADNPTIEKKPKTSDDLDIEINKNVAALSYLWVLCLVPLLGKKDSPYAQFHAKQGLVLFIIELIGGLIYWVPLFGQVLAIATIVVVIMGVVKTLNGERWEIPYIYELSQKINL